MHVFPVSPEHCSKLVVAQLPETTKTLFGQPDFRKNKGQVAREEFAGQPRKKIEEFALLCA